MRKATILLFFLIVLTGLLVTYSSNAKAQSTDIYIRADGEIVGTDNIQRNGDLYVVTGNISGGMAVYKSNIVIDGAGYALNGYGGTGIDLTGNSTEYPSPNEVHNVTIKNLGIINFDCSINARGSSQNSFYNDYMANTTNGFQGGVILYWNSGRNNITHCTIAGYPYAIGIELSSGNSITENNLFGGILLQFNNNEIIDGNYWSDYLTRYPNATELDSSGIGNTPYKISLYINGVVTDTLQDSHPLMEPSSIPDFGIPQLSSPPTINPLPTPSLSPIPSPTPTSTQNQIPYPSLTALPSILEFPSWIILPLAMITLLLAIVAWKKEEKVKFHPKKGANANLGLRSADFKIKF